MYHIGKKYKIQSRLIIFIYKIKYTSILIKNCCTYFSKICEVDNETLDVLEFSTF